MKKQFFALLTTVFAAQGWAANNSLGLVRIHNTNDKPVSVRFISEGNKALDIFKEVSPHGVLEVKVEDLELKGVKTYTIDGETHPFIGDKCKNLEVGKNYLVTFTNDTIGTTCEAQEEKTTD